MVGSHSRLIRFSEQPNRRQVAPNRYPAQRARLRAQPTWPRSVHPNPLSRGATTIFFSFPGLPFFDAMHAIETQILADSR